MERKTRAATETGIYLFIVAAIVVVANVLSFGAYKRIDLTKNERFTLSKGSKRLVHDLKKDLTAEFYVTRGMPKYDAFIQDVGDLLGEYERASDGKFHYTILEPKTDEEKQKAKDAHITEQLLQDLNATGEEQLSLGKGFMGLAFKYGTETDAIPSLSPDQGQGLEFWITNKIREIIARNDNTYIKVGVISGMDEMKLSDTDLIAGGGRGGGPSLKSIFEGALPFYKLEDVDLQGGDAEINQELSGVIVTQPGKEYTEKELRRIDQFLMRGNKSLAIIAGAVNMKASDASMKGTLNLWGLDKLTEGYGIEMKKDALHDWGRGLPIPVQTPNGQTGYVWVRGIVQAQYDNRLDDKSNLMIDTSFPPFFRLEQLAFPFPSSLVEHPDKQPEAEMKVVARTSPRTIADTSETQDLKYSQDNKPKGEFAQRDIAIEVDGILKSAFGGKSDDGIKDVPPQSKEKSRVLVISAPQFLANPFARSGNPPPMPPQLQMMGPMGGDEELMMLSDPYARQYLQTTVLAFKNLLDWMSGDPDMFAASAKMTSDANLTYADIEKPKQEATDDDAALQKKADEYKAQRKHVQSWVQWTLILIAPLLFAAFGVFRFYRRQSANEHISLD